MIIEKEYAISFLPFPKEIQGKLFGFIFQEIKKDRYEILIDNTRPRDQQKISLKHEFAHLLMNHFFQLDKPIDEIEKEAEAKAQQMTDEELQVLLNAAVSIKTMQKSWE